MSRADPSLEAKQVRQAAAAWLARRDAGLTNAEESEFRSWREADGSHAEALARYQRIWSRLDRPRVAGAAPQLQRDLALLERRDRRRHARWGSVAGLALVLAGATWWGLGSRATPTSDGSQPLALLVPERRVLIDGTVVESPANTVFTVDFSSPDRRTVTISRGTAHFQVAKNPQRPFLVEAAGVHVQAVGTAFAVQVAPAHVEVIVSEGRVAVDRPAPSGTIPTMPGAEGPAEVTLVDAGHSLSVSVAIPAKASPPQVVSLAPHEVEQRLAWRAPRIEFSNTPLPEVVAALNRYAMEHGGAQFSIQDAALEAKRLSGIFRVDDADAFVGILEKGFQIEAERASGQAIVLRAKH